MALNSIFNLVCLSLSIENGEERKNEYADDTVQKFIDGTKQIKRKQENNSLKNRFLALHYANKGRFKIALSSVSVHLFVESTWQAVALSNVL
ncbi:hypothetical protein T4A_2817 [Trichinella pseudospiralis]|uniref:Uncharacterized protein n=1 Tax=Trichinella pseudospiralis TaxID=6337 RepID=A0A0V1E9N2_TRIPS|nr:hypothetical protein T4A_2817 [Trichinella pseudospiralis]